MKLKLAYTPIQLEALEEEYWRQLRIDYERFAVLSSIPEWNKAFLFLVAIHEARLKGVLSEPL